MCERERGTSDRKCMTRAQFVERLNRAGATSEVNTSGVAALVAVAPMRNR